MWQPIRSFTGEHTVQRWSVECVATYTKFYGRAYGAEMERRMCGNLYKVLRVSIRCRDGA